MLCDDGLHYVKESVVLGERVGCWGDLGGAANRKLGPERGVGEKREDMAVD